MYRKLILASTTFLLVHAAAAHASFCIQWQQGSCVYWAGAHTTMLAFLGSPGVPLLNGTSTWDENAFSAANDWNAVGAIQFTVDNGTNFLDPCGARNLPSHVCDNTGPNGYNPIFFASSFCGQVFGDIIELTNNCWNSTNGQMYNAPVFVNANVMWNAYDGPLRFSNGTPIYDVRRVLVHELGHVLGLDHPDDHGQTVQAIMNSHVSNIDRLQADDINGALSIYSSIPGQSPAPITGTSGCQLQAIGGDGAIAPLLLGYVLFACRRRLQWSTASAPAHRDT